MSIIGAGDLHQVRFEDESLDDDWYQLALTLNASLPFGDAVVAASYFNRDFRYEADATDYEFQFNQTFINCDPAIDYDCSPTYDFGGDPAGLREEQRGDRDHDRWRRACRRTRARRAAGHGWSARSTARRRARRHSTASCAATRTRRSFEYFSYYETNLTGNTLAPTETWFLGRYDTELDQVAVFGELSFDVTENFTITAGGRWFDYDRKFGQIQEQPRGLHRRVAPRQQRRKPAKTARS